MDLYKYALALTSLMTYERGKCSLYNLSFMR